MLDLYRVLDTIDVKIKSSNSKNMRHFILKNKILKCYTVIFFPRIKSGQIYFGTISFVDRFSFKTHIL